MTQALSVFIPSDDTADFGQLPDAVRDEVLLWRELIERCARAKRPHQEMLAVAAERKHEPGFDIKTIERRYYAVKSGLGWRALVNRNRCKGRQKKGSHLTPALKREWHATVLSYQRNCRAAFRDLVRRYRAGETIGDVSWIAVWRESYPHREMPAQCPADMPLPVGFSYDTLMRHKPKRADLVAARIGEKAAATFRYQVHTTRKGMAVGQAYVFDDVWHDMMFNFVGQSVSVRPLELGAADVFSGYKLEPGFRPRRKRADGTREGLAAADMRFYVAHLLTNVGIHKDGCTLYVEHGTAAIPQALDPILGEWGIKVVRSGIQGVRQYAQLYSGSGAGNPRLKAGLESLHNLTHNETAALPAQVGMNRAHQPESLHGADYLNTKLLIACYSLTPERARLLRFPVMEWNQGIEAVRAAYYNMNRRIDHDLEGWVSAGLVKHQFRLGLDTPWLDVAELDRLAPDQRRAVEAIITQEGFHQVVNASPWDVWQQGQADLVRLPAHVLPLIVGADLGVSRVCPASDQIVFEAQDVSADPMIFETRVTVPQGWDQRLQEGREYRFLINPFDPRQCFVCQTDGAYLGMARRCGVPCKTDAEGLRRELGQAAKHEKEAALRLIDANRDRIKSRIADARRNVAVLTGAAVTAEERRMESQISSQAVSAADLRAATDFEAAPETERFSAEELASYLRDD